MNSKTISQILLVSIFALALFAFTPFIATRASASGGCTVTWTNPLSSYTAGSTELSAVTTGCKGTGSWGVQACSVAWVGFVCSGIETVQIPTTAYNCPTGGCVTKTLLNTVLPVGNYLYYASFKLSKTSVTATVSTLTVTPEFPMGMLLAVLAPVAGLVGYGTSKRFKILATKLN